jgi:hypothetical protein
MLVEGGEEEEVVWRFIPGWWRRPKAIGAAAVAAAWLPLSKGGRKGRVGWLGINWAGRLENGARVWPKKAS